MPNAIDDLYPGKKTSDTLLILLPCAYATPQDFITQGFVAAVRTRRIVADMVMVELSAAHYTAGQVGEYLQRTVIAPARAQGYRNIWIMGISLGGYGAALHCQRYGEQLSGVFLIAPFLGHRGRIAEIKKIGSVAWLAAHKNAPEEDAQLWIWLHQKNNIPHPPLYLGYGLHDKFCSSHHLLAGLLPPEAVYTTAGSHEWRTWHHLWEIFLDSQLAKYSYFERDNE